MVVKSDIVSALKGLGIKEDDIAIFHSSLKSFGRVDGGAECVIEAVKEALKDGTVVFPALVSRNFENAYINWDRENTPSDVGLISETFRKQKGVLRSDQATHSVTAYGTHAEYITQGHCDGKERVGVYGNTPFSHTSPWQKMYELDGKVVLLGVTMVYNTFKHFVEYCFVESILDKLSSEERKKAEDELTLWEEMREYCLNDEKTVPDGVWLWNDGLKEQEEMERRGLLKQTRCGEGTLTAFKIRDFYNFLLSEFEINPEEWLNESAVKWIKEYRR